MTCAQEQNLARPAYDIRNESAAAGTARLAKADCKKSIQNVATVRALKYDEKPYWDLERARIGDTRQVPVKLVVNGNPVARQKILADGTTHELVFQACITKSSWVALRILASSHTNPFFFCWSAASQFEPPDRVRNGVIARHGNSIIAQMKAARGHTAVIRP
jgi:hypothetical protein